MLFRVFSGVGGVDVDVDLKCMYVLYHKKHWPSACSYVVVYFVFVRVLIIGLNYGEEKIWIWKCEKKGMPVLKKQVSTIWWMVPEKKQPTKKN